MTQKRSRLKALYVPNLLDQAEIIKEATELDAKTDEELIASYNHSANLGIVGARGQHQHLVALATVLKKRFGDPIVHCEGGVIYMPCTVELLEDGSLKKTEFTDW